MQKFYEDAYGFMKRFWFSIPLTITLLLSFGTRIVTNVVSLDDLMRSRYVSTGYLGQNRFGGPLFFRLLAIAERYPVAEKILSTILLATAAILFCVVLKRASHNQLKSGVYTAFACLYASFPLIAELWNYSGTEAVISLSMCFAAGALLVMMDWRKSRKVSRLVWAAVLMFFATSFFESLAGVFVCGTFIVLFLAYVFGEEQDRRWKPAVLDGLVFAAVLAVAVALKMGLSLGIRAAMRMEHFDGATNTILYGSTGLSIPAQIAGLLKDLLFRYVLAGFYYLPIGIFAVAMLLGAGIFLFFWIRKKRSVVALFAVGMIGSCFLLSFVQGAVTPYRAAQPLMLYCAFIFAFALDLLLRCPKKWIGRAAAVVMCFLCLNQCMNLNKWFSLNYFRSEEEKQAVCQIAERINSGFDNQKPVVFVGAYPVSEHIMQQCRTDGSKLGFRMYAALMHAAGVQEVVDGFQFTQTSVCSYLDYTVYAAPDPTTEPLRLFTYYGFTFTPGTLEQWKLAHKQAENMGSWPDADAIMDAGDYLIVKLGPLEDVQ